MPNLSLPKTILSGVDSLIDVGGVTQTSPDNITIYNRRVSMRLLGGLMPLDMLLGPDRRVISSYSFWRVEASVGGAWLPLLPSSSTFSLLGTNSSGTFVKRSMVVVSGNSSGTFVIIYKATTNGPLKWDLGFTPNTDGHYRFLYSWLNISAQRGFLASVKQFQATFAGLNYTFAWQDIPSNLNTTALSLPGMFQLVVDLGSRSAESEVLVDPSIVATLPAGPSWASAYTFQRKVFYEPKGGRYWVFYENNDGLCFTGCVAYRNSTEGITWSSEQTESGGGCSCNWGDSFSLLDVYNVGQTVIIAWGELNTNVPIHLRYNVGTIAGPRLTWAGRTYENTLQPPYCPLGGCTFGIQYVNVIVTFDSTGQSNLAFSYNYFQNVGGSLQSNLVVIPQASNGIMYQVDGNSWNGNGCCPHVDDVRSVILPADSQGRVRVTYQIPVHQGSSDQILRVETRSVKVGIQSDPNPVGQVEKIDSNSIGNSEFSAVSDTEYGTHVVYRGATNGNASYAYRSVSGSSWIPSLDLFGGSVTSPTITVDYSTDDVYVLALQGTSSSYSIVMKGKSLNQNWKDQTPVYPVTNRIPPSPSLPPGNLTSNFSSASATNSSQILVEWTEWTSGPCCPSPQQLMFGAIPIQTVWSPFSAPSDPWDGNGLAPYGQYFANLGEYVSPSTGMLAVKQTDLSVPGRGLDLDIARVYTEPYSFLNNAPYNYERYPWAPLGDGWQLNFPWLNNTNYPLYIHMWDGEGYRIPSSFWAGSTATLENHQGENFRLVKYINGSISLYDKSGTSYYFNTTSHKLAVITDSTGNNTITFSYNNNTVSCVTDTIKRAFTFSYSNGLLQTIKQATGTCASPGATVRTISYANNGQSLTSVTDPAGRLTGYAYNATGGSIAQWLLARIRYPTSWLTNYTYVSVPLGTQAYSYRVNLQKTGPLPNSPVRQFAYAYSNPVGDLVTNSTVTTYNGTQVVSYTKYAFSFAGVGRNITDNNHNFVRGVALRFGVGGETPREIILVSPTQGYTNYYGYDLWGNPIYSRSTISSSPVKSHESFSAYYNNGLPPGFNAFQETFSQMNSTFPDNPWFTYNGTWSVRNGAYNGTSPVFNPPNQAFWAWTNFSSSSVSVIASIYITKRMSSSDQRVGLIGHYPGHGVREWALVLHNSTSGFKLSLLDELVSWPAEISCPLNYNTWYRFNFTISGKQAWGSATAPGVSCSIKGVFTSSDIASATGVGLYAGGYAALFDNVTITTVSPLITGTSFSNSFFQNGAPNSNVHGALAGSATLQNGPSAPPEETYYSYWSWGGINQEKSRYDPPAVQGSPNPLMLDGSAQGFCTNATSSCPATITTSHSNDIIVVFASETLDLQTTCSFAAPILWVWLGSAGG